MWLLAFRQFVLWGPCTLAVIAISNRGMRMLVSLMHHQDWQGLLMQATLKIAYVAPALLGMAWLLHVSSKLPSEVSNHCSKVSVGAALESTFNRTGQSSLVGVAASVKEILQVASHILLAIFRVALVVMLGTSTFLMCPDLDFFMGKPPPSQPSLMQVYLWAFGGGGLFMLAVSGFMNMIFGGNTDLMLKILQVKAGKHSGEGLVDEAKVDLEQLGYSEKMQQELKMYTPLLPVNILPPNFTSDLLASFESKGS